MEKKFIYNEFSHPGIDHSDKKYPAKYDEKMEKMRNYETEAQKMVELLKINKNDVIIDIGAGTGGLTLQLAKFCKRIYAVDTSAAMLSRAKEKSEKLKIKNIEFINSGFLNYSHKGEEPSIITTKMALHHLPDFWKVIALKKIHDILKNDGRFFLSDVILSFEPGDYETIFNNWKDQLGKEVDKEFANESVIHVNEEFSTFEWLMDKIIEKAGFKIKQKNILDKLRMEYYCIK